MQELIEISMEDGMCDQQVGDIYTRDIALLSCFLEEGVLKPRSQEAIVFVSRVRNLFHHA